MVCHSDHTFIPQRVLFAIKNFLGLNDKESAIVIAVIPVHNVENQEEIKTVLTRLPCLLVA